MGAARPGPKPNPNAPHSRYRTGTGADRATVWLPPMGCEDPAPELPPGRPWSDAERQMWAELWASPAASQWEESMSPVVSALVVASSTVNTSGRPSAQLIGELRALSDDLGLTPTAMARLGWKIGDDPAKGGTLHSLDVAS